MFALLLAVLQPAIAQPSYGSPPADVRAIQRAIDRAPSGAVVVLKRGRMVGSIRVTKPLTLRGAGRHATIFESRGLKAALVVEAPKGTAITIEGMSFTTIPNAQKNRGAGVMLSGPGRITITDVTFQKTIVGPCLGSAVSVAGPVQLRLERVQVMDHSCYLAGALVVGPRVDAVIVDSLIANNTGQLAGAMLVTGGRLRVEGGRLTGNRFARGQKGHSVVLANSHPARLELVAVDLEESQTPIAFEGSVEPNVVLQRMGWPSSSWPSFVQISE